MQKLIKLLLLSILFYPALLTAENAMERYYQLNHAGLLMLDKDNQILLSDRADDVFIPASTTKLLTAWLALKQWSEDHHFQTQFYWDKNKQVLWVKGSGDPYLISEELKKIAINLKALGLSEIKAVALDSSLFQPDLRLPGTGHSNNPYDAVPSAIAANFNTLYLKKKLGKVISAETQTPLTAYAQSFSAQLGRRAIRLNTGPDMKKAEDYFAQLLAAFLRQQGVKVGDTIIRGKIDKQTVFYQHKNSHSLADMVRAMLKYSTNFLANQLVLVLSAEYYQRPANAADVKAYMEKMVSAHFNWQLFSLYDGAGLSRQNRLSATQLVELLQLFRPWKHLLPEIESGIYAKSGTLNGISTLAGYITSGQHWQPFAVLMNQPVPYKFRNRVAQELANNHSGG